MQLEYYENKLLEEQSKYTKLIKGTTNINLDFNLIFLFSFENVYRS